MVRTNGSRVCNKCEDTTGFTGCDIGTELETVQIKPTFWRMTNRSHGNKNVDKCFLDQACPGTIRAPSNSSNSSSINASSSSARRRLALSSEPQAGYGVALCRAGHEGPYCASCVKEGYFGGSESQPCKSCTGDIGLAFVPLVLLSVAVLIVLILFLRGDSSAAGAATALAKSASAGNLSGAAIGLARAKTQQTVTSEYDKKVKASRGAKTIKGRILVLSSELMKTWKKLQVKLKILISLLQVLNGMSFVFSIPYPDLYGSTVGVLAGALEIDLPALLPLDCTLRRPNGAAGASVARSEL